MRKRPCTCGTGYGILFAAFGVGLLVATICPPKVMLVFIAAVLVIAGGTRLLS